MATLLVFFSPLPLLALGEDACLGVVELEPHAVGDGDVPAVLAVVDLRLQVLELVAQLADRLIDVVLLRVLHLNEHQQRPQLHVL